MRFIPATLTAALAFGACLGAAAQSSPHYTPLETIPGTPADTTLASPGRSRGEVLAAKQFGWLDVNHDGFLSRDEVALFPRLRDAFDQADQDRDNRVSLEEIRLLALQRRSDRAATAAPAVPGSVVEPAPAAAPRPVPPKEW